MFLSDLLIWQQNYKKRYLSNGSFQPSPWATEAVITTQVMKAQTEAYLYVFFAKISPSDLSNWAQAGCIVSFNFRPKHRRLFFINFINSVVGPTNKT